MVKRTVNLSKDKINTNLGLFQGSLGKYLSKEKGKNESALQIFYHS